LCVFRQCLRRIELARSIEIFHRAITEMLVRVGNAAIVEGIGVIGIALDRLIEVLDGAVVVTAADIGDAAAREGSSLG
jgi:hypothetical protein